MSTQDPIQEIFRLSRDFGEIKSDIKNVQQRMDRLEEEIKEKLVGIEDAQKVQDEKLDTIITFQTKMQGGWKATTILGGIIVTISVCLGWIADRWEGIKNLLFM